MSRNESTKCNDARSSIRVAKKTKTVASTNGITSVYYRMDGKSKSEEECYAAIANTKTRREKTEYNTTHPILPPSCTI